MSVINKLSNLSKLQLFLCINLTLYEDIHIIYYNLTIINKHFQLLTLRSELE